MDDDFNTRKPTVLFDMAREVNRLKGEDMAAANGMAAHLRKLFQRTGTAGTGSSVPAKRAQAG